MSELTLEHQEVSLGINSKTSSPLSYVALESPLLSKLGIGKQIPGQSPFIFAQLRLLQNSTFCEAEI